MVANLGLSPRQPFVMLSFDVVQILPIGSENKTTESAPWFIASDCICDFCDPPVLAKIEAAGSRAAHVSLC